MEDTALKRLKIERQEWKKNRPFVIYSLIIINSQGFYARLSKKDDGTLDYFKWECMIPGPKDSPWEGGLYKLKLEFPQDYPVIPPKCVFEQKLFHPNVYPSGTVCLSIINEDQDWRTGLRVKDILSLFIMTINLFFIVPVCYVLYCQFRNKNERRSRKKLAKSF